MKMKREVGCPICGSILFVEFDVSLIGRQSGKNEKCPNCHWLLWIPIKGRAEPVPIPIKLRREKYAGRTLEG